MSRNPLQLLSFSGLDRNSTALCHTKKDPPLMGGVSQRGRGVDLWFVFGDGTGRRCGDEAERYNDDPRRIVTATQATSPTSPRAKRSWSSSADGKRCP